MIFPIKIRGGIGRGDYFNENWLSTELDGDAYYKAREAIISIPEKNINTIFYNSGDSSDKFINMFSLANWEIKRRQSNSAKAIELILEILNPITISGYNLSFYEDNLFYIELFKLKQDLLDNKDKTNYFLTNFQMDFFEKQ